MLSPGDQCLRREPSGGDRRLDPLAALRVREARGVANRFTREQGPINQAHPAYPLATPALAPLRKAAEAQGSGDFSWFWSGQGAPPAMGVGAGALTRKLADEALALLG